MAQRFVMSIDQGITSTRCILFDQNARLVSVAQREHRQYYPRPGWVEQDAIEILSNNITGNLICRGNSRTWDNGDISEHLFPRQPEPNTVGRNRKGQCVLSSPNTRTDKPGPGPF